MKNIKKLYAQAKHFLKLAQSNDVELTSPQVKIEPAESLIDEAVKILQKTNPNYFVGVRKIVVDSGPAFGFVESGDGKDPATIHINLAKIKSDLQGKMQGASQDAMKKEIVRQLAITIGHERGHVQSYKPETGFVGGEGPAEAEEKTMTGKIDNYYNSLK